MNYFSLTRNQNKNKIKFEQKFLFDVNNNTLVILIRQSTIEECVRLPVRTEWHARFVFLFSEWQHFFFSYEIWAKCILGWIRKKKYVFFFTRILIINFYNNTVESYFQFAGYIAICMYFIFHLTILMTTEQKNSIKYEIRNK